MSWLVDEGSRRGDAQLWRHADAHKRDVVHVAEARCKKFCNLVLLSVHRLVFLCSMLHSLATQ